MLTIRCKKWQLLAPYFTNFNRITSMGIFSGVSSHLRRWRNTSYAPRYLFQIKKRVLSIVIIVMIASTVAPVFPQVPYIIWTKPCSTIVDNPTLFSIAGLSDTGYIVGGYVSEYPYNSSSNYDLWISYIDTSGNAIWSKVFPDTGSHHEYFRTVLADSHGHIIAAGTGSGSACRVTKVDMQGRSLLDTTYANLIGNPTHIVESKDRGYYMAVYNNDISISPFITKLDSAGKVEWTGRLEPKYNADSFYIVPWNICLDVQPDNSVLAIATFCSSIHNLVAYKFIADGTQVWHKQIADTSLSSSYKSIVSWAKTENGNILVAAKYLGTQVKGGIYKIDVSANLIWQKPFYRTIECIAETPEKAILVAFSERTNDLGYNLVLDKLDSNGNVISEQLIENFNVSVGNLIRRGNSYLTGRAKSYVLLGFNYPPFFLRVPPPQTREMFEDSILTDTIVAGDSTPTDSLRFFVSGLPNQFTCVGRTCIVRFTPYTDNDSGMHRISI